MNQADEQIQEFELTIADAKAQVGLAEALERLHKNPDFRQVIVDGYFRDEAARMVSLLGEPNAQEPAMQTAINNSLRSISELRQHFTKIFHFGELAHRAIEESQQAITEIENDLDPGEEA